MSTNFYNSEVLPPKIRHKMVAKSEPSKKRDSSSSIIDKSSSSTSRDHPESTNFSNSEGSMAAKSKSANNGGAHTPVTMKPPSSLTINDQPKSCTNIDLNKKIEEQTNSSEPVKHIGESSKTGAKRRAKYSAKQKGKAVAVEDSSKVTSKKRTWTKRQGVEAIDMEDLSKTSAKRRTYNSAKPQATEAVTKEDVDWTNDVPLCPTYYPSTEEFKDPIAYIQKISLEAATYGICKIVSPISPSAPPSLKMKMKKEDNPEKFSAELLPMNIGYREVAYLSPRKYTVDEFETMANGKYKRTYNGLAQVHPSLVEKDFWTKIGQSSNENVQYINGLAKSAFSLEPSDPLGRSQWNLKNFARLALSSLRLLKKDIEGVTDSLLYLGMLFSYIFWSAEPGHLYSIEYQHCGAPRTWYGSPGNASFDFERVVKTVVFPKESLEKYEAFDILAFKTMMFSPNIMLKHNVPIYKTVQYPGEFVITFPKAYHMGISHGFNCWEEARFTTPHWFPFGDEAGERCALYDRPQIVPYQELLCKEAMYMFENKRKELECHSYRDLKINFATLIRLYHFAFEEIKERGGALVTVASSTNDTMFCGACHRECYLAYIKCKCFPKPICIFHDICNGTFKCRCKKPRILSVREEIVNMQKVAKQLESEDKLLVIEVEDLVMIRGVIFGCTLRTQFNSELEELINIKARRKKLTPSVTKKP